MKIQHNFLYYILFFLFISCNETNRKKAIFQFDQDSHFVFKSYNGSFNGYVDYTIINSLRSESCVNYEGFVKIIPHDTSQFNDCEYVFLQYKNDSLLGIELRLKKKNNHIFGLKINNILYKPDGLAEKYHEYIIINKDSSAFDTYKLFYSKKYYNSFQECLKIPEEICWYWNPNDSDYSE